MNKFSILDDNLIEFEQAELKLLSLEDERDEICFDWVKNLEYRIMAINYYVKQGNTQEIRNLIYSPSELNELVNFSIESSLSDEYYEMFVGDYDGCSSYCDEPSRMRGFDQIYADLSIQLSQAAQLLHPRVVNYAQLAGQLLEDTDGQLASLQRQYQLCRERNRQSDLLSKEKQQRLSQCRGVLERDKQRFKELHGAYEEQKRQAAALCREYEAALLDKQKLQQRAAYQADKVITAMAQEQKRLQLMQKYISNDVPRDIQLLRQQKDKDVEQIRQLREQKMMLQNDILEYKYKHQDFQIQRQDFARKQAKKEEKLEALKDEFEQKLDTNQQDSLEKAEGINQKFEQLKEFAENLKRNQRDVEALSARNEKLQEEIERLRQKNK